MDAARHGRDFVRSVGWRGERGSGASYRRAPPPSACTQRGGNGERCYGACAHGVARSHWRVLYHIRRDEIAVRMKSNPPRNLPRRSFSKAGLPHNLPRPSPSHPSSSLPSLPCADAQGLESSRLDNASKLLSKFSVADPYLTLLSLFCPFSTATLKLIYNRKLPA